jgi:large subunit ribosomal protein L35
MKQKTHSGSKKRFRITGKNKVMYQHPGMRHNLEKKSSQLKRRLNLYIFLINADLNRVKKLLKKSLIK